MARKLENYKTSTFELFIIVIVTVIAAYIYLLSIDIDAKATNNPLFPYLSSIEIDLKAQSTEISICSNATYNPLCSFVANPICKFLFPAQILIIRHHKTGHLLSLNIQNILNRYCGNEAKHLNVSFTDLFIHKEEGTTRLKQLLNLSTNSINAVIIHFIRSPVSTILSGYEFHKICMKEHWLITPLPTLGTSHITRKTIRNYNTENVLTTQILKDPNYINVSLNDLYVLYNLHPYRRSFLCFQSPNDLQINWTDFNFKNSFDFAYKSRWKIHKWYNNVDDTDYGVFWEFIRYYNCEWHTMYLSKLLYTHPKLPAVERIKYITFELDSFFKHEQVSQNIRLLLDTLNVIDNEKNNMILRRTVPGLEINITEERNKLFAKLLKGTQKRPSHHQTHGKYNKSLLVDKLFRSHKHTCSVLKKLTILMDIKWLYYKRC